MPLYLDRRQSNIDSTICIRVRIDNLEDIGQPMASRAFNNIIRMYRHILNMRYIESLLIDNNYISYCHFKDHMRIPVRPDTGNTVQLCLECGRSDLRSCAIILGRGILMLQDKNLKNTYVAQNLW